MTQVTVPSGHVNSAWFLNPPADLDPAPLTTYLSQGTWTSPSPHAHAPALAEMQAGDHVVLKRVRVVRQGVPFFNADLPVSVMTLLATGVVDHVDAEAGKLDITWNERFEPRDWYFFTGIVAVWKVERDSHAYAGPLLDFVFHGADQDVTKFLQDPFWADRYPSQPSFDWVPFFEQLATRLLQHRHDRATLLEAVQAAVEEEEHLNYLSRDITADGEETPLEDIDPFTVMGMFNRSLTWENRHRLAQVVGRILGVDIDAPDKFDGVPTLNNQRSWFFAFARDRQDGDVEKLWEVFEAALTLADGGGPLERSSFVDAYDRARQIRGVNWNLSQGLFWVRPSYFAPMDAQSRAYLRERWSIPPPVDGAGYLELIDQLRERLGGDSTTLNSFPDLSHAAFTRVRKGETGSDVATLAQWGQLVAEAIDLDATENDYKRETAQLMRRTRQAVEQQDPGWPKVFRSALNASANMLHYIFKSTVAQACEEDPGEWAQVLKVVWEDSRPESFDRFKDALEARLGHVTDGNATGLAALLCMGVDAEDNAPYLTTRALRWYDLTQFETDREHIRTPADRYGRLLRFLDAVRVEVKEQSRLEVSRLEAQSLAWVSTEEPVPDVWDEGLQQALRSWRSVGTARVSRHAWIVRPRAVAAESWLADEVVTLVGYGLEGLSEETERAAVEQRIRESNPQKVSTDRDELVTAAYSFLAVMNVEDLVIVPTEHGLQVGGVSGPARPTTSPSGLAREVDWMGMVPDGRPLPGEVSAALDQQGTVIDLGEVADAIEELMEAPVRQREQSHPEPAANTAANDSKVSLPDVTDEMAARLHMDVAPLQEIVDILERRRQLILYGPPGTGKTYLAQHLGRHLVGSAWQNHLQLVQFHPSYAYEDFFEGFRPALTDEGQATFSLTAGPLARIAAEARANPGMPFVLVIDEINRANLAKVFGELYFLLEYRDQTIRLQYRPQDTFRLPSNLFIIGTMNTADRSIAMIDAAMRRRFAFIELHPQEEPVRGVLGRFVSDPDHDERPRLLQLLNQAMGEDDRDLHVGPTYLMRPEAATEEGLRQIWRFDILPLLEEHYYGRVPRAEVHRRFGLETLREGASHDDAPSPQSE